MPSSIPRDARVRALRSRVVREDGGRFKERERGLATWRQPQRETRDAQAQAHTNSRSPCLSLAIESLRQPSCLPACLSFSQVNLCLTKSAKFSRICHLLTNLLPPSPSLLRRAMHSHTVPLWVLKKQHNRRGMRQWKQMKLHTDSLTQYTLRSIRS